MSGRNGLSLIKVVEKFKNFLRSFSITELDTVAMIRGIYGLIPPPNDAKIIGSA